MLISKKSKEKIHKYTQYTIKKVHPIQNKKFALVIKHRAPKMEKMCNYKCETSSILKSSTKQL